MDLVTGGSSEVAESSSRPIRRAYGEKGVGGSELLIL